MADRYFLTDARPPADAAVEGYPVESSKSFCISCGLVVTVVGISGGSAAAANGYVAGVVVILISIPFAGLCFASALAN